MSLHRLAPDAVAAQQAADALEDGPDQMGGLGGLAVQSLHVPDQRHRRHGLMLAARYAAGERRRGTPGAGRKEQGAGSEIFPAPSSLPPAPDAPRPAAASPLRWLDFGCGAGGFLKYLRERGTLQGRPLELTGHDVGSYAELLREKSELANQLESVQQEFIDAQTAMRTKDEEIWKQHQELLEKDREIYELESKLLKRPRWPSKPGAPAMRLVKHGGITQSGFCD